MEPAAADFLERLLDVLKPERRVSGTAMRIGSNKPERQASSTAPKIEVPKPSTDRPQLGRVGIIAVVGFVIGIIWPRLAGVKLVPNAPTDEEAARVAGETSSEPSAEPAQSAPKLNVEAPAAQKSALAAQPIDRLKIGEAAVTSCRDAKNKRVEDCGKLDLDSVTRTRILTLASCAGTAEAQGTLSLGLELDFEKNRVKDVVQGKSTKLPGDAGKLLIECAKKEFSSVSLEGIEHKTVHYTVFYPIELLAPGPKSEPAAAAQADAGSAEVTSASGRATVTWNVALLRSEPNKDGEVVARVLSGTRVTVSGRQGDWYRVKYDAKGNEAWVYKSAIGL